MLRRTSSALAFEIPYHTIIVGGGTSGCLVANKLAMAGHRVAIVEEGADILKQSRWHYEMPCAQIAHRIHKRGYESRVATTPQKGYKGAELGPMEMPLPKVLGGSGVMGSKAWVHGDVSDWEGTPFNFKKDIRAAFQQTEGIANPLPYRGKLGRFFVSRPGTSSPTYKPFSEAMIELKQTYSVDFMNEKGKMPCGVGRPEVLVDRRKFLAHSTLRGYLLEARNMKRDVGVMTGTRVTSLRAKGGAVHGVNAVGSDGKSFSLEAKNVILAANPINNAQLLLRSTDLAAEVAALPAIGQNFFDRPTVVLQYKALINDTHQMFDSPVTRLLALIDWQYYGKQCAVTSSYDDLVCYWKSASAPSDAPPSVRISFQPFAANDKGEFNASLEHAMQFTIELLQPASRGAVTADSVNPNYYADPKDAALMEEAVAFVKSLAHTTALKGYLEGQEPAAVLEQCGANGGGTLALGEVVDEHFAVKGIRNVYVADGSILPRPALGSPIATTIATSVMLGDGILNQASVANKARLEEKEKSDEKPNYHPGSVGGQDDDGKQKYSNAVKVTYY